MIFATRKIFYLAVLPFCFFFIAQSSLADQSNPKHPYLILQTGGFRISQGQSQRIGIDGLIGDRFTLSDGKDQNVLIGVGCLIDTINKDRMDMLLGVNTFYFAHTLVQGNVVQEDLLIKNHTT